MRYLLLLGALFGQLAWMRAQTTNAGASDKTLQMGYSLAFSYNLYSWHRAPLQPRGLEGRLYSTGQVLNVLPGVGLGIWIGNIDRWLLSVESEWSYLPFALSVQQYSGLGILEVPTFLKLQLSP